ncbi:unnamed protein product, partial [Prunus brigantina]
MLCLYLMLRVTGRHIHCSMLCFDMLLIGKHDVLNLRVTPPRYTLFAGIQMEIIRDLSECGHYPLESAFMNSVPVETCSILVFSIQMQLERTSSLELWNMAENKCMTIQAHEGVISALA